MFLSPHVNRLLLLSTAVIFGSIPFFIPYTGIASLVALSLLITIVRYKHIGVWRPFSLGFLFGFFVIGFSIIWLYSTISFLNIEYEVRGITAFSFITIAFLSVVVPSAVIIGMWTVFISHVRLHTFFDILFIATSFVVFEYLRIYIVSFVLLGANMPLVPHFSFGMLGYSLADYILPLQFAVFGGIYTLSFLAALCVGILYHAYKKLMKGEVFSYKTNLLVALLFGAIFFPQTLFPFGEEAKNTDTAPNFAVVTEYFSPNESFLHEEMYQSLWEHKGIVVFPEGSRLFPPFRIESRAIHNFPISEQIEGNYIIDSGTYIRERGEKVGAAFISVDGEATLLREKEVLTPFGEYMPTYMTFFGKLLGFDSLLEQFDATRTFSVGNEGEPYTVDTHLVTAIFCHEIAVPGFVKTIQKETSVDTILVLASTRWFSNTKSLHFQTVRMAKIQAVHARTPLIRASYNDPGFAVDKYGRMLFQTPWYRSSLYMLPVSIPN